MSAMADFPYDELYQILSWLPAKSICKLKSSCKYFFKLPTETHFAMTQAQNSFSKNDSCVFIEPVSCQRYCDRIEVHTLPGDESSSGVSRDFIKFLAQSTRVLASSGGLLLCRSVRKDSVELFLCNPATQSWLPIPTPESLLQNPDASINVALECNKRSLDLEDYMIVLIESPIDWSQNYECKLYLPKEKTWKSTGTSFFAGGRNLKFELPVFHNGTLHYISDSSSSFAKNSPYFRPYIVAYNSLTGISTMLKLPKEARMGSQHNTCNMGIFKWGKEISTMQSICLVRLRRSIFTIWIMTDYKLKSWQKILKIGAKAILKSKEKDFMVTGFTIMNGDSLIFATKKNVYKYGLIGEEYQRLEDIGEHGCGSNILFKSYSNTLRPCGIGAATLKPHDDVSLPNTQDWEIAFNDITRSDGDKNDDTILEDDTHERSIDSLEVVPLISLQEEPSSASAPILFLGLIIFRILFCFYLKHL